MNPYRNEVHIHGTLVKDPLVRYVPSGKCVANLTILTKYQQYSEFHRVTAWEKVAETIAELKKGDFVKVVGRLQTRSWDDKQSGQKRYITEIVAFQIALPSDESAPPTPKQVADPPKQSPNGGTATARAILEPSKPEKNLHGLEVSDDDVPF